MSRPVAWLAGVLVALLSSTPLLAAAPPDSLAEKRLAEVRASLDATFRTAHDGVFIVAGNLPRATFDRIRRRTIRLCAERMWQAYFTTKPDYPIVIYLFADDRTYRAGAKKLFGDTDVSHFGYYRPWDHTLVMNIGTGTGTLVHEMTHALMKPDFPDAPTWFDEGLASLHEQCSVGRDTIIGHENWRLPALQKAIRATQAKPLDKLLAMPAAEFRGRDVGLHYAQARYVVLHLQRQGLLRRFYRSFRDSHKTDPTGSKTLARVTGQSLGEFEKAWTPWVLTLRYPPQR
ncbi:MAG: hypothetical protein ISS72_04920 [Candidatus Brocadiae bacterium]|nr:hypothetical protein [Candidatus Brocadiia bacterium]